MLLLHVLYIDSLHRLLHITLSQLERKCRSTILWVIWNCIKVVHPSSFYTRKWTHSVGTCTVYLCLYRPAKCATSRSRLCVCWFYMISTWLIVFNWSFIWCSNNAFGVVWTCVAGRGGIHHCCWEMITFVLHHGGWLLPHPCPNSQFCISHKCGS